MLCSIAGCTRSRESKGLCNKHYLSQWRYGDPLKARTKRPDGTGCLRSDGYIDHNHNGKRILEHVLVAEKVIGKPLPRGAEVHHIDENRANNKPQNLVICPDKAYHKLLHQRMRAMASCGNPNYRKCPYCKTYDAIENMKHSKSKTKSGHFFHSACINAAQRMAASIRNQT